MTGMDNEALHQVFAKVVDASFAFTMAFNTYGANSQQALDAHAAYEDAMREYNQAKPLPFAPSTHWDNFCSLHPTAPECLCYDV